MNSGIDIPTPTPNTIIAMVASWLVEFTSIRESMNIPATMIARPTIPRIRYLPSRDISCPAIALAIAIAIIIGIVTNPEFVADAPITPCTNSGR